MLNPADQVSVPDPLQVSYNIQSEVLAWRWPTRRDGSHHAVQYAERSLIWISIVILWSSLCRCIQNP